MENKNISQIVLERIKGEGIKPMSRNIFYLKRILFWLAVVVSLIIGAFAFSLVLSGLFNNDWDLYDKFGFNFVLRTLPYFWFISFVLFTFLGEFYYRKTLLGHRRGFIFVIGVYIASSVLFGSIFYMIGIGDFLEQDFMEIAPIYRNIILNRSEIWTHPEDGLLSGRVIQVGDNEIELLDSNGAIWTVDVNSVLNENQVELKVNDKIKITGDIMDDNFFIADEIRAWQK